MKKAPILIVLSALLTACAATQTTTQRDLTAIQQKAAMGDVAAQAELGYSYQYGDGVSRNPTEALKWNRKAAEQGSAMAQHNLAVMYDEGRDIPEDNVEAVKWYQKAAAQGHPSAKLNLGVNYWRGEGVAKDLEKAWNLLNSVRMSSRNKQAQWAARNALDQIKKEVGATVGPFDYPDWETLQKSIR